MVLRRKSAATCRVTDTKHDSLIEADVLDFVVANIKSSHRMASITAEFLNRYFNSLDYRSVPSLPPTFLLEVAAILRISMWQEAGLTTELNVEIPAGEDLFAELIERLCNDPLSFYRNSEGTNHSLSFEVFKLVLEKCSWGAMGELGCDVLLDTDNRTNEAILDNLAQLLLQNLHTITRS